MTVPAITVLPSGAENSGASAITLRGLSFMVSALVAWVFFQAARELRGPEYHTRVRRHLMHFGKGWAVLAGYYGVLCVIALTDVGREIGRPISESAEPSAPQSFVFVAAMLVCMVTNWFLVRGIGDLASPSQRGDEIVQIVLNAQQRPESESLEPRGVRKFALGVVAGVGILAAGGIGASAATGAFDQRAAVELAFYAQLSLSSILFLWLAFTYVSRFGVWSAGITSVCYALSQLFYPKYALIQPSRAYAVSLLLLKGWFGITMLVAVPTVLRTTYAEAHRAGEDDELHRQGCLMASTKWCWIVGRRVAAGAAMTFGIVLVTLPSYLWTRALLQSGQVAHAVIVACGGILALAVVPALTAYLPHRFVQRRTNWKNLSQGSLANLISAGPIRERDGVWRKTVIASSANSKPDSDAVEVVLLHGIFADSEATWGLLPAILIDSKRVSRVHMFSYDHYLFSGKNRYDRLCRDFADRIASVCSKANGRVVIFAHSLGAFIAMRAAGSHVDPPALDVLERLKHVGCVGAPIMGSGAARLAWFSGWCRRLRPSAPFVTTELEEYVLKFPPPGEIVGEAVPRPSFSFLYGEDDAVAASRIRSYSLPATLVRLSGGHGDIACVLEKDGPEALAYLNQLDVPSRGRQLAAALASHLLGETRTEEAVGFVFTVPESGFNDAEIIDVVAPAWGQRRRSLKPRTRPLGLFREELRTTFDRTTPQSGDQRPERGFEQTWRHLRQVFDELQARMHIVRVDVSGSRTMHVGRIGAVGFAVIAPERLRHCRSRRQGGDTSPSPPPVVGVS